MILESEVSRTKWTASVSLPIPTCSWAWTLEGKYAGFRFPVGRSLAAAAPAAAQTAPRRMRLNFLFIKSVLSVAYFSFWTSSVISVSLPEILEMSVSGDTNSDSAVRKK